MQPKEEISMLNAMLDYLNTHALLDLLDKNKELLNKTDKLLRTGTQQTNDGTLTKHRELLSIRQNILQRLGEKTDREKWFPTHKL